MIANRKISFGSSEFKSVFYIVAGIVGIMVFIFVGIFPKYKSSALLDQKIDNLRFQVEEQKKLLPLYEKLKEIQHNRVRGILPYTNKGFLPREQVDKIFEVFRVVARKFSMDAISLVPDMNTLTDTIPFLSVSIVVRGDYFDFRNFLIGLGEIPYVEHIETIEIQQMPNTKEFKLKVWLAIASPV